MNPTLGSRSRLIAVAALIVITAALTTLVNQAFFGPADSPAVAPVQAEAEPVSGPDAAGDSQEPDEPDPNTDAPGAEPADSGEAVANSGEPGAAPLAAEEETNTAEPDPEPGTAEAGEAGHSHSADAEPPEATPKLCVVADGDPGKLYWKFVKFHARRAGEVVGLQLEYSTHPDPADRVQAIEACARNGAPMILATLADPQVIIPALHAAAEQGARIASFGAGAEHADEAGSLIHVSMDASAAARRAADHFTAAGVSGTVLCLIPEGVEEIRRHACDELAKTYVGGTVDAHQLAETDPVGQIADILVDSPDAGGILVLEADLLPDAIEAMDDTGIAPVLGSIGEYPLSKLEFAQRDQIAFTVMDLARFEVLLSAAALRLMHTYHPSARYFEGAMIFEGVPNVHTGGARGGHERPGSGDDHDHGDHDHAHADDGEDHH